MLIQRKTRHAVTGQKASAEVCAREKTGKDLKGTVLTDQEIFYTWKFKRLYIPLEEIVWAYMQVARSRIMRGQSGVIHEYRILYKTDKGGGMVIVGSEPLAKEALQHIQNSNSKTAIGFTEENKARFGAINAQ